MQFNYFGSVANRKVKFTSGITSVEEDTSVENFNSLIIMIPSFLAAGNIKGYDGTGLTALKPVVKTVTADNYQDVLTGELYRQWAAVFNSGANTAITVYLIVFLCTPDTFGTYLTVTAASIDFAPLTTAFNKYYYAGYFKFMFSEHYDGTVSTVTGSAYDDSHYFDLALSLAYLVEKESTLSATIPFVKLDLTGATVNNCGVLTYTKAEEIAGMTALNESVTAYADAADPLFTADTTIVYTTGVTDASSVAKASDYIAVPSGTTKVKLTVPISSNSATTSGIAFYTSDKVYVSGVKLNTASVYGSEVRILDIPATAGYMKTIWFSDTATYGAFSLSFGTSAANPRNLYFWGALHLIAGDRVYMCVHSEDVNYIPVVFKNFYSAVNVSGIYTGNKLDFLRLSGDSIKPTGLVDDLNADANDNLTSPQWTILDSKNVGYLMSIADGTLNNSVVSQMISVTDGVPVLADMIAKYVDYHCSQDIAKWLTSAATLTDPVLKSEAAYAEVQSYLTKYLALFVANGRLSRISLNFPAYSSQTSKTKFTVTQGWSAKYVYDLREIDISGTITA